MAEDAWNSRDPARVALAYTETSQWRNRSEFVHGRATIQAFLQAKWEREHEYDTRTVEIFIMRLRKKLSEDREAILIATVRGVGYVLHPAK